MDNYLYKFGKQQHIEEMLKFGRMRIAAASSFDDPSLNLAVRDKELEVSFIDSSENILIQVVDEQTLEVKRDIAPIGDIQLTLESPSDYYVMCFASIFESRLFDEFGADACLIIRDPLRFVTRIFKEIQAREPKWTGRATFVTYYNPQSPEVLPKSVFFYKDNSYKYQQEYRIVFRPSMSVRTLEPIFIEMGNLEDYCELVNLESVRY